MTIDHGHIAVRPSGHGRAHDPRKPVQGRCLAFLDQVESTHRSIVVTKHGRPAARLVPLEDNPTIVGSVTLLSEDDDDHFSTGVGWDADA